MSTAFEFAVAETLEAEGVFSDDPQDPGGPTAHGISAPLWRKWGFINSRQVTKDDAIAIYRQEFWEPLRLDEIDSKYIAAEIFDTAVNQGARDGAIAAQLGARSVGRGRVRGWKLRIDGDMGPLTLAVINALCPRYEPHLYQAMNGWQFVIYLGADRAHLLDLLGFLEAQEWKSRFFAGWMRRLARFEEMLPK